MAREKVEIGGNRLTTDSLYTLRMRGGKAGGGKGPLLQDNLSGSLMATNDQKVFQSMTSNDEDGQVHSGYMIRRLTPLECERLQGMPDDHTRVPFKGKPAEACPDYLRYKVVGNSMAVNVMRWIGERVAEVSALLSNDEANKHTDDVEDC